MKPVRVKPPVNAVERRHVSLHPVSSVRTVFTACAILALAAAGSARADDEGRAVIIQNSNGFPGAESSTDLARQTVTIVGQRLRVLDEQHAWALYVSVPEKRVREVPAFAERQYVTHGFDFYKKYRDDRAKALTEQAAAFVRARDRLLDRMPGSAADLRDLMQEYTHVGGDPAHPGQIRARVERFPQDRKTTTILVDRAPRTVTLDHVQVRENNATKPVFELWVTIDVLLPVDIFVFWQQLGTFAPEVSALLPGAIELPGPDGKSVRGTVIECVAVLDAGTFQRELRSQVLEIRTEGASPQDVTAPEEGWTEKPVEQPARDTVWCAMTGVVLERQNARVFHAPNHRTYYYASQELFQPLLKVLREGKEPPYADGPAQQPPGAAPRGQ